jgi:hypothetical protein
MSEVSARGLSLSRQNTQCSTKNKERMEEGEEGARVRNRGEHTKQR